MKILVSLVPCGHYKASNDDVVILKVVEEHFLAIYFYQHTQLLCYLLSKGTSWQWAEWRLLPHGHLVQVLSSNIM